MKRDLLDTIIFLKSKEIELIDKLEHQQKVIDRLSRKIQKKNEIIKDLKNYREYYRYKTIILEELSDLEDNNLLDK